MPARKLPPNDTVIEMYNSGMFTGQIAEMCGVKPVTVVSLLRRLDVPRRNASDADRLARKLGRKTALCFWTGKQQPAEMVEKRVSKIRGENHYLWKGGKAKRDYRDLVVKTSCEKCSATNGLAIHHKNGDHYDNRVENL